MKCTIFNHGCGRVGLPCSHHTRSTKLNCEHVRRLIIEAHFAAAAALDVSPVAVA